MKVIDLCNLQHCDSTKVQEYSMKNSFFLKQYSWLTSQSIDYFHFTIRIVTYYIEWKNGSLTFSLTSWCWLQKFSRFFINYVVKSFVIFLSIPVVWCHHFLTMNVIHVIIRVFTFNEAIKTVENSLPFKGMIIGRWIMSDTILYSLIEIWLMGDSLHCVRYQNLWKNGIFEKSLLFLECIGLRVWNSSKIYRPNICIFSTVMKLKWMHKLSAMSIIESLSDEVSFLQYHFRINWL
jgi:hypothetical protein